MSACHGVILYEPVHVQNYVDGDFETATQSGEIRAIVLGNPFDMDDPTFAALVAGYMRAGSPTTPVTFTVSPGPMADINYRVVILFNPPLNVSGYDLCTDGRSTETQRELGNSLTAIIAFC